MHHDRNATAAFERAPYAAMRSVGQDACVIGPKDEIVVEIGDCGERYPIRLAMRIADMLNQDDFNHCCNEEGRAAKAQHLLLLVRQNGVSDNDALETLSLAIDEAGATFSKAELAELTGAHLPF